MIDKIVKDKVANRTGEMISAVYADGMFTGE